MSIRWEPQSPQEGPRAPENSYCSPEVLWRPKPIGGRDGKFLLEGISVECSARLSSFAPSLDTTCESTAPSEGIWPSPASPLLDSSSECNSPVPVAAAARNNDFEVEIHQLSPNSSSKHQDKNSEDHASLMLPPASTSLHSGSGSGNNSGVSPLVQFLRRAKVLKSSLSQTMELQQQSLQLLLLHPRIAPPALDVPCCWCSAATGSQEQQQSCVVMLQLEMLQDLLQQSSAQLQQQHEDLHRGEVLLYEEQQRELQHQQRLSTLFPDWQHQQNQAAAAAAAAELRIRRSVLKHHCQQLEEALLQQQRLQQEAKARWLVEAADQIKTCYPEASDAQVVKLLQPQGGDGLWGCELSDGLIGSRLKEKREKLLRLEESKHQFQRFERLRQLQHLTGLLYQAQQKRQQQQQSVAAVIAQSEKLTAAACTDLLIAHKYRGQTMKTDARGCRPLWLSAAPACTAAAQEATSSRVSAVALSTQQVGASLEREHLVQLYT